MKKIFLSLILPLISVFAYSQWITIPSGTQAQLRSVYFVNADTGYAVGTNDLQYSGIIFRTMNGGVNWNEIFWSNNACLNAIYFIDDQTGYAVGDWGTIYRTYDGGLTWTLKPSGTTHHLYAVHFPDANTGYAVGIFGTIRKTTNGGSTWNDFNIDPSIDIESVYFTDASKGYVAGSGGRIYRTTNGGLTWTYSLSGASWLRSVKFTNDSTGYAVGYRTNDSQGTITKTINSGKNWNYTKTGTTWFNSVSFPDENTGYAVGNLGTIVKTTDGGTTWTVQSSGTTKILWSVSFPDNNTGYAVGDSGTILKTTNGGVMPLVTPSTRSVSSSAGSTFFIVTSDTNWVVSSDAYWCNATSSGSSIDTIIATYSENNTITERVASITVYAAGSDSMAVTVTQSRSSIGIENISNDHFQIYPNPTAGLVTIETAETVSNCQLFLINLNGQKLIHQTITKPKTLLDLSTLPQGIYFVKIVDDKMVKVAKVVKQ
jgi:photosystem II stability/assembly factor-like uncharacterized protein